MASGFLTDDDVRFEQKFRPVFPGSPARPLHPLSRRVAYFLVGCVLGLAAGFGNALVLTNTVYLQGALGADASEAAWIPTVYVMTFITMNLVAVKFRQQFGLRLFTMLGISAFCVVMAIHLVARDFVGAVWVHALAGVASAPLLTLTLYYFMSAFPPAKVLNASAFALAISQVGTPLARLFPGDDFIHDQWVSIYYFELGLALICLVLVGLVRLPPSEKDRGFEYLDMLSYPLLAVGFGLLTIVIGLGRFEWWTDRDWLGWCLAGAIPLIAFGFLLESSRNRPLLEVRWLGAEGLFRFLLVVVCIRVVLAQQQTVAFGLLGNVGVLSTNVRMFSVVLVAASVLGCLTVAWIVKPTNILFLGAVAMALAGAAALYESFSSNLTRAPELLVTEAIISFATTLAVGPTIGVGLGKVVKSGGRYLASFLVILSIAQNLGGLSGSSILGTIQILQEKANSVALIERTPAFDAAVQARINQGGGGAAGVASLQKAMTREANVLAYNNVSFIVAVIAFITAIYLVARGLYESRLARRTKLDVGGPSVRS